MDTLHPQQAPDERMITITGRERIFLMEMLEGEIAELRSENYHAESHAVKELLKEREYRTIFYAAGSPSELEELA